MATQALEPPVESSGREWTSAAIIPYGAAVLLSAFLLFQIQPIIAKLILAWFGGSAGVWAVAMLFFQGVLLLGYLYAHLLLGCPPRVQMLLHLGVLLLSVLALPVLPDPAWKPAGDEDPMLRILLLLAATVGLPYFVLASTSPLLQAWYTRCSGGKPPYRLFALSNLASLAALILYPTLVEPLIAARRQAWIWSLLYAAYAVYSGWIAWQSAASARADRPAALAAAGPAPDWKTQASWLLLAASASTLLLALTNYLCQDIAAVPFLWILPLSAYLLTFILCFEREGWYRRGIFVWLHAAALPGIGYVLLKQTPGKNLLFVIPLLVAALWVCCMYCHGEMVRRKPHPAYLTQFYLMVALGGALGGILVGLLAPRFLSGSFELPIALAACAVLTLMLEYRKSLLGDLVWTAATVAALVIAGMQIRTYQASARIMVRNFYGGSRVVDSGDRRALVHGAISHGSQFLDAVRRRQPTTYYAWGSGVQLALTSRGTAKQRVGLIGLGAGTLAAYGHAGDTYRYYEINPQVLDLARREFTFLGDSLARIEVALGDGRLSLEREQPQGFDVLAVDAFSGDSIPVHLLSLEAFRQYFRHLKPDGILALHLSNSLLDLMPVAARAAEALGKEALWFRTNADTKLNRAESDWVLLAAGPASFASPELRAAGRKLNEPKPGMRPWTDDYSNLFKALK